MTWSKANNLIAEKITKGLKLNPELGYRIVVEIPPDYHCSQKKYGGSQGFKVQIGKKTFIDIPVTMLQTIYEDAVKNNCIYNKNVFRIHYPTQAEQDTGHPCHIHVVGKIFEVAGIAFMQDKNNYRLIE